MFGAGSFFIAALLMASGLKAASVMTLPSSFAVDYTGAATLNIPIDVPPGRAGMKPNLSLSYSSSNGNGYVGVGWTLSGISAITRCPQTIATNGMAAPVTLTLSDKFCFQGNPLVPVQQQSAAGQQPSQGQQFEPGQQLIGVSGTYGADGSTYTTEIEGFSRIVAHGTSGAGPSYFQVYTKSGLIYEYGNTTDNPNTSNNNSAVQCTTSCNANTVVTWMLDKVTDAVGNNLTVSYLPTNGLHAYPTQILYTWASSLGSSATNIVNFGYIESRPDAPVGYIAGQPQQTNYLLQTIITYSDSATANSWGGVSTYTLAYGTGTSGANPYGSGITGRSRLTSITKSGYNGSTLLPTTFKYCDLCNAPADLLTNFSNGLDVPGTSVSYLLTTHSSIYYPNTAFSGTGAPSYPTQNLVTPRYVVSAVSAPTETGSNYAYSGYNVSYTYYNGATNLQGRGFLGFQAVLAKDAQTQVNKQSNYSQTFPTIGQKTEDITQWLNPYISVGGVATPTWEVLQNTNTTFSTCPAYNGRTFPCVTNVATTGVDLWGDPMPATNRSVSSIDGYGNDLASTTTTTYNNTVYTTAETDGYQNDQAGWSPTNGDNWIVGRLTSHQVAASYTDNGTPANSSGTTTRLTQYVVDQNTGLTKTETVEPGVGTGFTFTTTFGYDAFGNKTSASAAGDGQTRANGWTYTSSTDIEDAFPDAMQNALSQSASTVWDPRWGVPLSQTDIDGRITSYTYDDLGRETSESLPDGSKISISYLFCSGVNGGTFACPTGAQYAIQTTHICLDGVNEMSPTKIAYYDIVDREIDTDSQSFNGVFARVTKTYNSQLQLASVTRPYFLGATPAITTYSYDPLNRLSQTNHPDGSWDTIGYSETNNAVTSGITSTYPGQEVWNGNDAHGNHTLSIQYVNVNGPSTPVITSYLYDGFNNLTKVVDAAGNVTRYSYDLLGRKTNISDPDAGTRTQTYNAFDDLISIVDGRGTTAWMSYDALSRMTFRCWTNGQPSGDTQTCPSPSANEIKEAWSYDPANGIGELGATSTTHGAGSTSTYTYNGGSPTAGVLGKVATLQIAVPRIKVYFNYSYTYGGDNRLYNYVAPSGANPFIGYNTYGYTSSLLDGGTGTTMWVANSRDAENHLTSATYGNGVTTTYQYNPNTGLLTSLVTLDKLNGTHTVQSVGYTWDQLANLIQRSDAVNGLTENYAYDGLNRLQSITLPNNTVENSFSYDLLGNMLTKGDVGTYTYPPAGSAQPHGVSSISSGAGNTTFSYDADGNLTAEAGATVRTITPDIINMTRFVTYGGKTFDIQYDADHNRVLSSAPEGTSFYVPDGELVPGNVWHTYFEVDGERVAEDYGPPGGPFQHHYFQNDYQNSIGLVTNDGYVYGQAAGTAQNEGSDVFGQPRLPSGAADATWGANDVTRRRYINQEDLLDAHLIDLNARLYDPLIGKFLSPDPVIADQDDSQSWNAYAYSHNNPMSGEDPTGLACGGSGSSGSTQIVTVCAQPKLKPPTIIVVSAAHFVHTSGNLFNLVVRAASGDRQAQRTLASHGQAISVAIAATVSSGASQAGSTAEAIAITVEDGANDLGRWGVGAAQELGAGVLEMDGGGSLLKAEEAAVKEVEEAAGAITEKLAQGPRFARGELRKQVLDKGRAADGTVTCVYCGRPTARTADHIIPFKKGGATKLENLDPACVPCNSSKGAKDLGTEWVPPKDRE